MLGGRPRFREAADEDPDCNPLLDVAFPSHHLVFNEFCRITLYAWIVDPIERSNRPPERIRFS